MDIANLIASVSGDSKGELNGAQMSMDIDSTKLPPVTSLERTYSPVSNALNLATQSSAPDNLSDIVKTALYVSCEKETTIEGSTLTATTPTTTAAAAAASASTTQLTTRLAAAAPTITAGMTKPTQNATIQYIIVQPNGGIKRAPVPMASLLHKDMNIDSNPANVSKQIPVAKLQSVLNKTQNTITNFGGLKNMKANGNMFVLSNNLGAVNHKPEPGRDLKQATGDAQSFAKLSGQDSNVRVESNKSELLAYQNTGAPSRNTDVIYPNIERKNQSAGSAPTTPVYRICVSSGAPATATKEATQPRISFIKAMTPTIPDALPVKPITSTATAAGSVAKEIVIQLISRPDVPQRKSFLEPCPSTVDNKLPGTGLVYRTPGANNINKSGNVKRPMNAFMVWARDFRSKLAIEYPGANNSEISVRLGQVWQVMTGDQKRPFYEEADRIKAKHKAEFPGWVYRPLPGTRRRTECKPTSQPCSKFPEINSVKTEPLFHQATSTTVSIIKASESGLLAGLKPVPTANALNNSLMMAFAENNGVIRPHGTGTQGHATSTECIVKKSEHIDFINSPSTSNAGPMIVTCEVGASGVVRLSNSGLATSLVDATNDPDKPAVTSLQALPPRTILHESACVSANLPHGSVLHTQSQGVSELSSIDAESSKKSTAFPVNYHVKTYAPIQSRAQPAARFEQEEIEIKTLNSSEMEQAISALKPPEYTPVTLSKRGRPASTTSRLADLRKWAIPVDVMAAAKANNKPKKKRKMQSKGTNSGARFPLEFEQSGLSLLQLPPPQHPDNTRIASTNVDKFGDLLLSSPHVTDPYEPFYMGRGKDNFKDDTSDLDVKWWTNLVDDRTPSPEENLNVLLSSARVSHSNCSNSSNGSDLDIIPVPASATLHRLQCGNDRPRASNNTKQPRNSYSRTACKAPPSGKLTSLARARLVSDHEDHDTIEAASGLVALRHRGTGNSDLYLNLAMDNKSNCAMEHCRDVIVRSASPHDLSSVCSSLTMCVDNPISFKTPISASLPEDVVDDYKNSQAINLSKSNAIHGFPNMRDIGENDRSGQSNCTIPNTIASQLPSLINTSIEIGHNSSDKRGIVCQGAYTNSLNGNIQDAALNKTQKIPCVQSNTRRMNSPLHEGMPCSGTAVRTPPRKLPTSNGDAHTAEQGPSGMDSKYASSLVQDSGRSANETWSSTVTSSVDPTEIYPKYYSQTSRSDEFCITTSAESNLLAENKSTNNDRHVALTTDPVSQFIVSKTLDHYGISDNADKKPEDIDETQNKDMPIRVTRSTRPCKDYLSPPKKRRYFLDGGL